MITDIRDRRISYYRNIGQQSLSTDASGMVMKDVNFSGIPKQIINSGMRRFKGIGKGMTRKSNSWNSKDGMLSSFGSAKSKICRRERISLMGLRGKYEILKDCLQYQNHDSSIRWINLWTLPDSLCFRMNSA